MSEVKNLTAKQELFCREYLIDLNGTQAAIRAGYSKHTACQTAAENLRKPYIAEFIAGLKQERSERVQIDADWVLRASKDLFDKCMEAEPLSDSDGNEAGMAKFHPAGAAKAIELIGKHVAVNAFTKQPDEDKEAPSLNITFKANDAVDDIKVTRGE